MVTISGLFDRGLSVPIATPHPLPQQAEEAITSEAGIFTPYMELRVQPLAQAGDLVAQGAPVLKDRRRDECVITAPMACRIAEFKIGSGRRLESLVFHSVEQGERHKFDSRAAREEMTNSTGSVAIRALFQASGLWMYLRARPFGRVPGPTNTPAAIFVMAVDTRPLACNPRLVVEGDSAPLFERGLDALARLTEGPVYLCQDRGPDLAAARGRVKIVRLGSYHPAGLAGIQMHQLFPARIDREVWEIAAEDVVAIGYLLAEGSLPATKLVAVTGPGMRQSRLVRCQPGADLRELCYAYMTPGQRTILSGSVLDGQESRWLGIRDRQVTVVERPSTTTSPHWLRIALLGASRPAPVIPTAAVEHALGGILPVTALLRALSVGDDETAMQLGALSLLEEDLALVDYITCAQPRFSWLLRAALNRIEETS